MKNLTILCLLLISSISVGYAENKSALTDEREKYAINSDGDVYFSRELSTSLSFTEVCAKVTEIISPNFVNVGAGVSLNNLENLFIANYIFPAVQKDFPLVLDAWAVLKVELQGEVVRLTLTMTNYSKKTSRTQEYIRISNTQPLNPKGEKYGFRSQNKLINAFDSTVEKASTLFGKLQQVIENYP